MPPVSVFLTQIPAPGEAIIPHAGDTVTFRLKLSSPANGQGFLRTNLRHAARRRAEIIAEVEQDIPPQGLDWEDVPMKPDGPLEWSVTLPLPEPGVFEARAGLLPEGGSVPLWPEAQGNVRLKVEPAWTVAGNSIYAVFPRLYTAPKAESADNPDISPQTQHAPLFAEENLAALDGAGYTVIPPSGTFRQVLARLDHILTDMKFRIVLLLPPFPTPTTHARMGRYGSPFAPLDFYTVDPALAEFDRRTTPLQQFHELADGIHARGGRLFIDIPINHTGWASRLLAEHPEWFARNGDGTFHSPGAWGVVWEDLVKLSYDHQALWREMADVFLHWCRQGVDGFRCDAGYFIPAPVWMYITAKVRQEFPDTVFLLEGLGGPIPVMLELLTKSGLNWAYSELFQNENRAAMDWYLPQAAAQSATAGYQINFAETHDNNRLAAVSSAWARLRTAVAALCSPAGGWGLTCGAEWLATEKINVHGFSSLNEGAAENQIAEIQALQTLLEIHPAFAAGAKLQLITVSQTPAVALRRTAARESGSVLVLLNPDAENPHEVTWREDEFAIPGDGIYCLLTEQTLHPVWWERMFTLTLQPGQVLCLNTASKPVIPPLSGFGNSPCARATLQEAAALAQRLERAMGSSREATGDFLSLARRLLENPAAFCREVSGLPFSPVTVAHWPRDRRRTVVWLPGDLLLITADVPFCYSIKTTETTPRILGKGCSLPAASGNFALIARPAADGCCAGVEIQAAGETEHPRGVMPLYLPGPLEIPAPEATGAEARRDPDMHVVLANGAGAMSHVRAAWGEVRSQYDALLAANPHPDFPVDRRMLLNRCRVWIVRRGFTTEVNIAWLESVRMLSGNSARWEFNLPCGDGHLLRLAATVSLTPGENTVSLTFYRLSGDEAGPVRLIIRPDVEDRGFHEKWSLDEAAMRSLNDVLTLEADAFTMPCHHGKLVVRMNGGTFASQPERMEVEHPVDLSRGQGNRSELFSPGYFDVPLTAPGDSARLTASLLTAERLEPWHDTAEPERSGGFTLRDAVRQFIVKRDDALTVIAGYPWFLDWGRDTLICLRGIAAAGELEAVRGILKTFARFEKQGTLPNMIRGDDDSNRDTSDAPLWFFTAVADLLERERSDAFLEETAGGRTIREVLVSLGQHCTGRLFNGIEMDPESGLMFSPSHFTWMDTNHPAGTPREGYPICIQSLWFAALKLLARVDSGNSQWAALAAKVQASILEYFVRPGQEFLSDCLHAAPGTPAGLAVADDHLRPNQLLAVTLGAVTDAEVCRGIIKSSLELLVPGALRTLADRPVNYELPVYRDGRLLNDPKHPFCPQYLGDEDTQRKPAYHNGTGWPWLMPMLAEAMLLTWGEPARERAAGVLASSGPLFRRFALGTLEECVDGATPHAPRACGAQAWSVTEWLRVAALVQPEVLG